MEMNKCQDEGKSGGYTEKAMMRLAVRRSEAGPKPWLPEIDKDSRANLASIDE